MAQASPWLRAPCTCPSQAPPPAARPKRRPPAARGSPPQHRREGPMTGPCGCRPSRTRSAGEHQARSNRALKIEQTASWMQGGRAHCTEGEDPKRTCRHGWWMVSSIPVAGASPDALPPCWVLRRLASTRRDTPLSNASFMPADGGGGGLGFAGGWGLLLTKDSAERGPQNAQKAKMRMPHHNPCTSACRPSTVCPGLWCRLHGRRSAQNVREPARPSPRSA